MPNLNLFPPVSAVAALSAVNRFIVALASAINYARDSPNAGGGAIVADGTEMRKRLGPTCKLFVVFCCFVRSNITLLKHHIKSSRMLARLLI